MRLSAISVTAITFFIFVAPPANAISKKPAQGNSKKSVTATAAAPAAKPADKAAFKTFKGPKAGEWSLAAKVKVPGQKEISQDTTACVKAGEDIKQRALGQLGDASQGCVVSITKDTDTVGELTSKCPSVSASLEITRISDDEFRYNVRSTMAAVTTIATYKGPACTEPPPAQPKQSSCDSCKQMVLFMKDQCSKLSDATRSSCNSSLKKLTDQCAAQCKSGK